MKIKFLTKVNNKENPEKPYLKNNTYDLPKDKGQKVLDMGWGVLVEENKDKLLDVPVCGLDQELKSIEDVDRLQSLIDADGRKTAKQAYQERISELIEKK